ncbi:O-antigen polymerase [Curtobacterium sp. 24E2]|nr:oligosaccharide repeat unit polymerase [Curtobacterium sp. 24E2]
MSISTGYVPTSTALGLSAAVGTAFALVCLGTPRGAGLPDGSEDDTSTARTDAIRLGSRSVGRGTLTWMVCGVYSLVTYGVMAATVGIHVRLLALDDIYEVRADYSADVGSGGTLGYLLTGQAYVINPLVLARGIFRRRPSLVVLALAGQFLLYSSTGFKAVLFSFIAVLGMALLFRGSRPARSLPLLAAPLVIMVASAVADEVQGGITWTSVFTRRFMLTPGLLSSVYVDYFSDNPVARYGYSFLSAWVDYPYDLPPPKRIADFLVPGSVGYANANLFADGFANFGWIGIFVAAAALFVWLRFLDRAARGLPMRVAAMAVVMPSIMLSNTSIFTAMLSHGLLMGTIVIAIAPRTGWERSRPHTETAIGSPSGAVTATVAADGATSRIASPHKARTAAPAAVEHEVAPRIARHRGASVSERTL